MSQPPVNPPPGDYPGPPDFAKPAEGQPAAPYGDQSQAHGQYPQQDYAQAYGQGQYPQQQYGQYPQQDYPGQYAAPYGATQVQVQPTPQRSNNKGLLIGVGALVAALVVGVGAFAIAGGGGDDAKPEEAVKAYLTALSNGDANAALALGKDEPSDKTLLTNDVLGKQQAKAKISEIATGEVEYNPKDKKQARVDATYKFGSHSADETFYVDKVDGKWKLTKTIVERSIASSLQKLPGLTFYGVEVSGKDKLSVFPGPVEFGTTSTDFKLSSESEDDKFPLSPRSIVSSYTSYKVDLTDAGKGKVATALKAFLTTCLASKTLEPENTDCPNDYYASREVLNTAVWKVDESSLEKLRYYTSPSNLNEVEVSGSVRFTVTFQQKDYDGKVASKTASTTGYMSGEVDLSKNPPTYSES